MVALVGTADIGIARIGGTPIAVITIEWNSGNTISLRTGIADGADIAVLAGVQIGRVDAPGIGVAGFISAIIAVVAIHSSPGAAGPQDALIANGAFVSIFASETLMGRLKTTFTGVRVAGSRDAGCIDTFGLRARHHRILRNLAEMGQL